MPPLAPLQPLPPQIITTYVFEPDSDTLNTRKSTFYPTVVPMNRPASNSVSSTATVSSNNTTTTNDSVSITETSGASVTSMSEASPTLITDPNQNIATTNPEDEEPEDPEFIPELPIKNFMLGDSFNDNETVTLPQQLFPTERLTNLSARSLAMQLYRSCQTVLGCQEAMWEELTDRIRDRPEDLIPYGWEDDDELEELQGRNRFDKLIDRFKKWVQSFVGLIYLLI